MTSRLLRALPLLACLHAFTALAAETPLQLSVSDTLASLPSPAAGTEADNPPPAVQETQPGVVPATTSAGAPEITSEPGASIAPLPVTELAPHQPAPETIDLTTSPEELFQRIRNGFAMANLTGDLVLTQQQWYMNRPDYLRRMVDRSSRYLHYIVEEIERRGMPTELAFLPMVESAFNPLAYSRAHASGLWQFIPSTGKNYNLRQDWWMDQRRDVVAATNAALDYLQTIYDMHGDWFLALASYNWGEGAVARAIKKNEAKGLPTDYKSLSMPAETRNYVPKLQALKNIFSNPQLVAQLNLAPIPNRAYFATVTPSTNIDVKVAAKLADMPVQEFVALNPAHNRPVIKSDTPLVIPADKLETFQNNLENHQEEDRPLSKWQTYTLQPGEKLEKVAPRFGIALADLKRINGLQGRIKTMPSTLLVPAEQGVGSADMAALQEQPRLPSADPVPAAKSIVVKKGESLAAVAKRGSISVADLRRINQIKGDRVAAGTRLSLVAPESMPAQKTASVARGTGSASPPKTVRYTVKKGDTLQSVARQFRVDPKDLLRWNRGLTPTLRPGQQLTIQNGRPPAG